MNSFYFNNEALETAYWIAIVKYIAIVIIVIVIIIIVDIVFVVSSSPSSSSAMFRALCKSFA